MKTGALIRLPDHFSKYEQLYEHKMKFEATLKKKKRVGLNIHCMPTCIGHVLQKSWAFQSSLVIAITE